MLHKGMWYEEMINNRNKSVVRDMKWTADGRKIAIVYEDGAVIVGSVDGNRLWGKELNMPLRFVEWSPDSRWILFVTLDAEVWLFDADGGKIRSITLVGQDPSSLGGEVGITGIHWFCSGSGNSRNNNHVSTNGTPLPNTLCIAFDNGKIQLSRGDNDATSEIFDTGFTTITYCRWSSKGNVLAVVGTVESNSGGGGGDHRDRSFKQDGGGGDTINMVKFFDAYGSFIRSIRIPGERISAISWEGGDLRLSLAVDSYIYFANIRHKYMWAYYLNTVVFSYPRSDHRETAVVFWDLVSLEAHTKSVQNLKFLVAGGDMCALVVGERTPLTAGSSASAAEGGGGGGGGGDGKSSSPLAAASKRDHKRGGGDDSDDEEDSRRSPKGGKGSGGRGGNKGSKGAAGVDKQATIETCTVQLRNAIGAVVDTKVLPFVPKYVSMSAYHVVATNDRTVYAWQFQSQVSRAGGGADIALAATAASLLSGDGGGADENSSSSNNNDKSDSDQHKARVHQSKVRMFDIANTSFTTAQSPETFQMISETISDPIVSSTISDKFLVIGRKSGTIQRFNLPHLTPENTYNVPDRREPSRLSLNCDSSKLGFVDTNGLFSVLDLEARVAEGEADSKDEAGRASIGAYYGKKLNIDRKDVWDMCWSEDDADMIVVMEKTKMVVINGETAEEPVVSSAYLARFRDLEVRVVAMDTLMQHPDKIAREYVVDYESKPLREARDVINAEGLQGGYIYAEKNSHPRLWKLVAHAALEDLELSVAEKSFVRCGDYYGVQLVKQLQLMPDKMKARAEASVYLGKYDEAETLYREIDRKDLAIQLRKRLGDYSRVVQLLQTGGGNDSLVREAWDKIGEHYADRLKWKKAAQYFQLSRNFEKLAECYYRLENFEEMSKLKLDLPDDSPLLITMAKRFETVGMHQEAVDCYLRSTRPPKEAVDCCVLLNRWDLALELAERYDYPQVEGLLIKYAMNLVSSDRKLEAVELFRVANKPTEAAILIGDIAETVATRNVNPALAKKLHVLAALEIERHRKRAMDQATQAATTAGGNIAQATAATLETLMMTALDTNIGGPNTLGGTLAATLGTLNGGNTLGGNTTKKMGKAFGNAWRGAAAYHYYMLSLKQFYDGNFDAAMKTAIKLCEYDDILNPRYIYSLLCLAALRNKFYGVCSKAFVKLETLRTISEVDRDALQTLAVQIFIKNSPTDPAVLPEPYIKCLEVGRTYKACVISGRAIQESPSHMCKTCRHLMLEHEMNAQKHKHCSLCHSPLMSNDRPDQR